MKAILIRCKGHVQGVFYRVSTLKEAQRLGLKGWVRNEQDGSVLIHAEGTESALESLIGWCKVGPPLAMVSEVDCREASLTGFETFQIN